MAPSPFTGPDCMVDGALMEAGEQRPFPVDTRCFKICHCPDVWEEEGEAGEAICHRTCLPEPGSRSNREQYSMQ